MKNLYYRIWVDLITGIQWNPEHKNDWRYFSMFFMTTLISLNLLTVAMLLGIFNVKVFLITIDVLPGTILNNFASGLIQFVLPSFILNYFLVLHREKFKKFIIKYEGRHGKIFLPYLFISVGVFIIPVLLYWWIHKVF